MSEALRRIVSVIAITMTVRATSAPAQQRAGDEQSTTGKRTVLVLPAEDLAPAPARICTKRRLQAGALFTFASHERSN